MPLVTATLADLYIRQGHYAEAVRVLEALVQRSPERAELRERLTAARDLLDGGAASMRGDAGGRSRVALLRALLDRVVRRRQARSQLERAS